jgi:hypothetical protein
MAMDGDLILALERERMRTEVSIMLPKLCEWNPDLEATVMGSN